jgi:hypothetical protein
MTTKSSKEKLYTKIIDYEPCLATVKETARRKSILSIRKIVDILLGGVWFHKLSLPPVTSNI